jgi:hypothetical protein
MIAVCRGGTIIYGIRWQVAQNNSIIENSRPSLLLNRLISYLAISHKLRSRNL